MSHQNSAGIQFTFEEGFYAEEGGWRWMGPAGEIQLRSCSWPVRLSFEVRSGPETHYRQFPFQLFVTYGDLRVDAITVAGNGQPRFVEIVIGSPVQLPIRLQSSEWFVPAELGLGSDLRSLSVCLSNFNAQAVEKPRPCPLCDREGGDSSHRKRKLGSLVPTSQHVLGVGPTEYDLMACSACELIFLSPLPSAEVYARLYISNTQFDSHTYGGFRSWWMRTYYWRKMWQVLGKIAARHKPIRLLEIGSGFSWMSRAAKQVNRCTTTVAQDISPEAKGSCPWVDHFIVGDLESKRSAIAIHAPFHVISMTHVIEHLPDPVGTLQTCATLLDRNGLIFVTAPLRPRGWNHSAPFELWEKWYLNHTPAHLQYFNRLSLEQSARQAGLKLVFYKGQGHALEAWLGLA